MQAKQNRNRVPAPLAVTTAAIVLSIHVWMLYTGWMLANRKIPPNPYVGNRTERTLADPEIWYQVNALAGEILLVAGAIAVPFATLFAIALFNARLRKKLRISQAESMALLVVTLLAYIAALFAQ